VSSLALGLNRMVGSSRRVTVPGGFGGRSRARLD
jgi:hypothetical protein